MNKRAGAVTYFTQVSGHSREFRSRSHSNNTSQSGEGMTFKLSGWQVDVPLVTSSTYPVVESSNSDREDSGAFQRG